MPSLFSANTSNIIGFLWLIGSCYTPLFLSFLRKSSSLMHYWVDGSEHYTQIWQIYCFQNPEAQRVLCLIFSGRWCKLQQFVFHLGGDSLMSSGSVDPQKLHLDGKFSWGSHVSYYGIYSICYFLFIRSNQLTVFRIVIKISTDQIMAEKENLHPIDKTVKVYCLPYHIKGNSFRC